MQTRSTPLASPKENGSVFPPKLGAFEASSARGKRKRWAMAKLQILAAFGRLDWTFSPSVQFSRLRRRKWNWRSDGHYFGLLALALANLSYISSPGPAIKLLIIVAYTIALLVPFLSQFFLPGSPVLSWVLLFWSARFFAGAFHPPIWVSVLPTLESVLYGANISDLCTRYTNMLLDVIAWIPYGVGHFAIPAFVAISLFLFGPPGSLKLFGRIFGYMNLTGVLIQMFFPCAPPWYELVHGMIPADYSMGGSPGGLARIDALFGGTGYTVAFSNAPVPFGAFPSLHAGCATMEALFLSHFFPRGRPIYWLYVFVLYYLIDLVAGGALAVGFFSCMMTEDLRHLPGATHAPTYVQYSLDMQSSNAPAKLKRMITVAQLDAGVSPASYGNGIDPAATALIPNGVDDFELAEEHGEEAAETTARRSSLPASPQPPSRADLEAGPPISRPGTPGGLARSRSPRPT